jgi:hypothetical protein
MKFRDLQVGDTFDFVSPNTSFNSFYLRCTKVSARRYRDEDGHFHQVGSINAVVYHVVAPVIRISADSPFVEVPTGTTIQNDEGWEARVQALENEGLTRSDAQAVVDAEDQKGPRSWAPEVIADNSGKWAGNALRFATKAEAEANVQNLSDRWFLVRETRVVESTDEPNYRWVPGTGLVAIENLCPLCGERRGAPGTHKC